MVDCHTYHLCKKLGYTFRTLPIYLQHVLILLLTPSTSCSTAAVATEIPDEFGPGPMEGSVLRFLKEHRLCAVWEGEVKFKPTTC